MGLRLGAMLLIVVAGLIGCTHATSEAPVDLGRGPNSEGPYLEKSKAFIAEGQFEKAAIVLRKAVKQNPEQIEPILLLGAVLLQLEEVDKAERLLGGIINRWPQNTQAQLLMGYALLAKQKRQEARLSFEKVIDTAGSPDQRLCAHLGLAAVYEDLKDQTNADAHYAKALEIEPDLWGVLVNIQKEMAWYAPQPSTGSGEQHIRERQKRIKQELKKLGQKDSGNE